METTAFYRSVDNIQNLVVAVTIKKITADEVDKTLLSGSFVERESLDQPDRLNSTMLESENEWRAVFSWQKKSFGPGEILRFSQQTGRKPERAVEIEYAAEVTRILDSGEDDIFETPPELMLYSYTDKDSFSPSSLVNFTATTSSSLPSHLFTGVSHLPTLSMSPGQAHLFREAPFRSFYIVAAVDIDRPAFQSRSAATAFEEVPLCRIKSYTNSELLEVSPPFSHDVASFHEEGADSDSEAFVRYRFTAKSGQLFEYTIANASMADARQAEEMLDEEWQQESEAVAARTNRIPRGLSGLPDKGVRRMKWMIEVLAVHGIEGEQLSFEYEVSVPPYWAFVADSPPSAVARMTSGASQVCSSKKRGSARRHCAHFCFPLTVALESAVPAESAPPVSAPELLLGLGSADSWGRNHVEGYCRVPLPLSPGFSQVTVGLWKPEGSIREQIADFFVGGALQLSSLKFAGNPTPGEGSKLCRQNLRTLSKGQFVLRLHTIELQSRPEGVGRSILSGLGALSRRRPKKGVMKITALMDSLSALREKRNAARTRLAKLRERPTQPEPLGEEEEEEEKDDRLPHRGPATTLLRKRVDDEYI